MVSLGRKVFFISLVIFFAWNPIFAAKMVPAFPGAEGGGALTVGGRGGRIIEVTNLKSRGPGSLRFACEAKGPRIVIFKVAGTIEIKNRIAIGNPYITIAGQTAPGGGILVKGGEIEIITHDVVIRFLRVRTGRQKYFAHQEGDCIALRDGSYNVVIDHCSVSWSNDENIEIWSAENPTHNVTFSWNMIAEGLSYDHASCGLIVGSHIDSDGIHDISIHHNVFMNCKNRMPLVKCRDAKVINNLIYNWSWWPTGISGGIKVDIIGNKYVAGPVTARNRINEVMVRTDWEGPAYGPSGDASIYIKGNLGPRQNDSSGDNWVMLSQNKLWMPIKITLEKNKYQRTKRMDGSMFPITIDPVSEIETMLLKDIGASRRLDEKGDWVFNNMDSVDKRLVSEYLTGKGQVPVDETTVGGYPIIETGEAYVDSDHDGMSDVWEKKYDLDATDPSDAVKDKNGDGYTNVEEFLNATSPGE